jgi:hypothetical protein
MSELAWSGWRGIKADFAVVGASGQGDGVAKRRDAWTETPSAGRRSDDV